MVSYLAQLDLTTFNLWIWPLNLSLQPLFVQRMDQFCMKSLTTWRRTNTSLHLRKSMIVSQLDECIGQAWEGKQVLFWVETSYLVHLVVSLSEVHNLVYAVYTCCRLSSDCVAFYSSSSQEFSYFCVEAFFIQSANKGSFPSSTLVTGCGTAVWSCHMTANHTHCNVVIWLAVHLPPSQFTSSLLQWVQWVEQWFDCVYVSGASVCLCMWRWWK